MALQVVMNFELGDGMLNKSDLLQSIRYLFVGGSSALLELCLFWIITHMISNIPIANISALIIATSYNFLLNRSFAFKSEGHVAKSAIRYLALFCFNSAFSTITIMFMSSVGFPPVAAKLFTMCCIVVWNYFLYRNFVFKSDGE